MNKHLNFKLVLMFLLVLVLFSTNVFSISDTYISNSQSTIFLSSKLIQGQVYPIVILTSPDIGAGYSLENDFSLLFNENLVEPVILCAITNSLTFDLNSLISSINSQISSYDISVDSSDSSKIVILSSEVSPNILTQTQKNSISLGIYGPVPVDDIKDLMESSSKIFIAADESMFTKLNYLFPNEFLDSYDNSVFKKAYVDTSESKHLFTYSESDKNLIPSRFIQNIYTFFNVKKSELQFEKPVIEQNVPTDSDQPIVSNPFRFLVVPTKLNPELVLRINELSKSLNVDLVIQFDKSIKLDNSVFLEDSSFTKEGKQFLLLTKQSTMFQNADYIISNYSLSSNNVLKKLDETQDFLLNNKNSLFISDNKKSNQLFNTVRELSSPEDLILVDNTYNGNVFYFIDYPEFNIDAVPKTIDLSSSLEISKARKTGVLGLYDYYLTQNAGKLWFRAISRYPLAIGVSGASLETILAISGAGSSSLKSNSDSLISASGKSCVYCNDAKKYLEEFDSSSFSSCSASCCVGKCPSNSLIQKSVTYIDQCSSSMGGGGDCWHDGVAPERENPASAESYCSSGCGVAATRMAFSSYSYSIESSDLFCGGDKSIYTPGGTSAYKLGVVSKSLGFDSEYRELVKWDELKAFLLKGKLVILSFDNKLCGVDELPYKTSGHYITAIGIHNNFIIANDPFSTSKRTSGENTVLSKTFVEKCVKRYVAI